MKKCKCIKYITIMMVFVMTLSLNFGINMSQFRTCSSPNKYFLQVGIKEVEAGPVTKTMNVGIEEGALNTDTLSKTITIPKLKNIVNVTVNTGTIALMVKR